MYIFGSKAKSAMQILEFYGKSKNLARLSRQLYKTFSRKYYITEFRETSCTLYNNIRLVLQYIEFYLWFHLNKVQCYT